MEFQNPGDAVNLGSVRNAIGKSDHRRRSRPSHTEKPSIPERLSEIARDRSGMDHSTVVDGTDTGESL